MQLDPNKLDYERKDYPPWKNNYLLTPMSNNMNDPFLFPADSNSPLNPSSNDDLYANLEAEYNDGNSEEHLDPKMQTLQSGIAFQQKYYDYTKNTKEEDDEESSLIGKISKKD